MDKHSAGKSRGHVSHTQKKSPELMNPTGIQADVALQQSQLAADQSPQIMNPCGSDNKDHRARRNKRTQQQG